MNTMIIEYTGEVITPAECVDRYNEEYSVHGRYYFLDYEDGYILDAGRKGNETRFVNHSCEPNCVVEKWHVPQDSESRIVLVANRKINAGEELTYDYNLEGFGKDGSGGICYCGAINCRGTIGKKPSSSKRKLDSIDCKTDQDQSACENKYPRTSKDTFRSGWHAMHNLISLPPKHEVSKPRIRRRKAPATIEVVISYLRQQFGLPDSLDVDPLFT